MTKYFLLYFLLFCALNVVSMDQTPDEICKLILTQTIFGHITVPEKLTFNNYKIAKRQLLTSMLTCKKFQRCSSELQTRLILWHHKSKAVNDLVPSLIPADEFKKREIVFMRIEKKLLGEFPRLSLYLLNFAKIQAQAAKARKKKGNDYEFWHHNYQSVLARRLESELFEKYLLATTADLRSMFEQVCDVNARDSFGYTPLYYAIRNTECSAKKVELLVQYGADIDNIDGLGNNALDVARSIRIFEEPSTTDIFDGYAADEMVINEPISENKLAKIALLEQYKYKPKENKNHCQIL